jgi:hypothetical protein
MEFGIETEAHRNKDSRTVSLKFRLVPEPMQSLHHRFLHWYLAFSAAQDRMPYNRILLQGAIS